jgi:hypothetical protein
MMRGARDMLGRDLDLAFASEPNAALRDSLRRAANAALPHIDGYVRYLERDVIPKASGDFAIGAANLSRRYLAEELIETPLATMVAIGERELARSQAEFRAAAAKLAPGAIRSRCGRRCDAIIRRWAASSPQRRRSSTRCPRSSPRAGSRRCPQTSA